MAMEPPRQSEMISFGIAAMRFFGIQNHGIALILGVSTKPYEQGDDHLIVGLKKKTVVLTMACIFSNVYGFRPRLLCWILNHSNI